MARGPLAGASGPGKYSKRTDMSLGSTSYGEGGETAALNTAAAKSKTRGIADNVGGRPVTSIPEQPVTSLFASSERPSEPITSGIDIGEGPTSAALMMGKSTERVSDILAKMLPYDTTGEVAILYQQALARGQ
jgi:hypothetical protein